MLIISAVVLIALNSISILAINPSRDKTININLKEVIDDEDSELDEEINTEQLQLLQRTNGLITRAQAESIALERFGGQVIGFESERENGRIQYDVKLKVNGEVIEVEINALTGEITEVEYGEDDEDDD